MATDWSTVSGQSSRQVSRQEGRKTQRASEAGSSERGRRQQVAAGSSRPGHLASIALKASHDCLTLIKDMLPCCSRWSSPSAQGPSTDATQALRLPARSQEYLYSIKSQ